MSSSPEKPPDQARFEKTVSALMQVGKEELAQVIASEKKSPRTGKKRGRKPKA
jgi:hypothetical protein